VLQCVTFALPHDKLGEEVAVVVVLRNGAEATAAELREFAARRLADFKVPKKVFFRPEIPKGATGKLQQIGLAQKLGLA
jgi:acyl-CoA synthetase (AMP-forming)/AMP-acid ligase II